MSPRWRSEASEAVVLTIRSPTDENPTPPQSPGAAEIHISPPSTVWGFNAVDDHEDNVATPTKKHLSDAFLLPSESAFEHGPSLVSLSLPSPSLTERGASTPSPTTPTIGALAARRAASGKLPNKALVSLQQMSFEASNAGTGLGVGPGSAGWDGMEGISPGTQGIPGLALRVTIGGNDEQDGKRSSAPSSPSLASRENVPGLPALGSPTHYRSSSVQRRRSPLPRSPGATFPTDPFAPSEVKIPPTLRGSRLLDKLNLSASPQLNSLLSPKRERPNSYVAPPSPLMRSSAFTYTNTGPLTPLTPSHIPGAPTMSSTGAFEWFSYSMPDSPSCPTPPVRSIAPEDTSSASPPKQAYFKQAAQSEQRGLRRQDSFSRLPPSPLGTGRFASGKVNPFFAP